MLVYTGTYYYNLHFCSSAEGLLCVQDTIVVIPPYPYSITEDIADVPFKDCWYARPQLFFQCQCAVWFTSVPVRTCMYQYVPVCTMN